MFRQSNIPVNRGTGKPHEEAVEAEAGEAVNSQIMDILECSTSGLNILGGPKGSPKASE